VSEIRSSYANMRDFAVSSIWVDLSDEINNWLDDIHSQLESEVDHNILMKLQGNAEACRNILALPNQMLEALEIERRTE